MAMYRVTLSVNVGEDRIEKSINGQQFSGPTRLSSVDHSDSVQWALCSVPRAFVPNWRGFEGGSPGKLSSHRRLIPPCDVHCSDKCPRQSDREANVHLRRIYVRAGSNGL
jgi:hypothetical protein